MSTTPAVLPHVDAVTAAHQAADMVVHLGGAPQEAEPPYAVLYPTPGRATAASLADDRTDFTTTLQITCVGKTAEQALNYCDRSAAVLASPLSVDGRTSWKPEQLDGEPVKRDDDVNPPVYYGVARYRLRSIPS